LWIRLAQKHPFAVVAQPVTAYAVTRNSLSQDPERTIADTERMLEGTLLCGLRGPARLIWRRKIRAAQVFRAALNARSIDRARDPPFLLPVLGSLAVPIFFWQRLMALRHFRLRMSPRARLPIQTSE